MIFGLEVTTVTEWYRYRIVTCLVTSSSPVPLKSHRVGQQCTLNLSRAETSSRWCGQAVGSSYCMPEMCGMSTIMAQWKKRGSNVRNTHDLSRTSKPPCRLLLLRCEN
ncbi:histone-lysine N-methyltransferase SETMAR [Trichonephila clavipes]|nr:histone-lysine N-methyltransferase SETMAR [Trichonephila clavipes]